MELFDYIVIAFGIISVLIVLFFAIRTKKFFKTLIFSALIGISTLLILHFTSGLTGFSAEITPFTLSTSGVFGLPGVIAIVICKMIFGL